MKSIYHFFLTLIATVFGVGFIPLAPGTWGSLAAIPLAWSVAKFGAVPYCACGVGLFALGTYCAHYYAQWKNAKDPQVIVIDEVIGMWIALWWLPFARTADHVLWTHVYQYFLLALSFALFRFFDITKYWLARRAENLPGGWGIVLDDVVAGVYAALCVGVGLGLISIFAWQ